MGEWTEVAGPDGAFKAYVARPAGAPKAAVVVIQEIFGVNAVMRHKSDWLASKGYLAICPDLFWRLEPGVDISDKSEAEWAKAMQLMNAFKADTGGQRHSSDDHACARLRRGEGRRDRLLPRRPARVPRRVPHRCGRQRRLLRRRDSKFSRRSREHQEAAHVACCGQRLVRLTSSATADARRPRQQSARHAAFYPEQDHAFTREGGVHYDADAARIADARTVAFFGEHLA